MVDQRSDRRFAINHAYANLSDGVDQYVSDLSRTGAFVRMRQPLQVGANVNLVLSIAHRGRIEIIEARGHVVRAEREGERCGVGVEFVGMQDEMFYRLDHLLDEIEQDTGRL
jgi:hypothetical protein